MPGRERNDIHITVVPHKHQSELQAGVLCAHQLWLSIIISSGQHIQQLLLQDANSADVVWEIVMTLLLLLLMMMMTPTGCLLLLLLLLALTHAACLEQVALLPVQWLLVGLCCAPLQCTCTTTSSQVIGPGSHCCCHRMCHKV